MPHFSPMNWVLLMGWFWFMIILVSLFSWWFTKPLWVLVD
uniref:ATP synthase F0 subunit 8 n=1 Tax=Loripes lacteus TaxID=406538 RepID=C9V3M2_9BIVA|nr:ATP synthase F0 subunit 8 [Loripes lacteus]ABJ55677.1 ATP synthase F0 subunit 8 [Loripes lacteus]